MNLLKLLFSVSYKNVLFSKRGFHQKNSFVVNHLENVGRSFLNGYHKSLDKCSVTEVATFVNTVEDKYRGFTSEGASMGLTIKDFLSFNSYKKIKQYLEEQSDEIYINHVGIGWAFSRLPVRIETQILQFDDLLRWLIIDGYGFHQAYFKTKEYVFDMAPPNELKNPFAKKVFYQGIGRALWFVESTDILRIYNRVQKFPENYHSDLWAGIGLAAGYAGGCNADEYKQLRYFSGSFYEHLYQGVCFGVSARVKGKNIIEGTKLAASILCNQTPEELYEISEITRKSIDKHISSEEKYAQWKEKIRLTLSKSYKYEELNQ